MYCSRNGGGGGKGRLLRRILQFSLACGKLRVNFLSLNLAKGKKSCHFNLQTLPIKKDENWLDWSVPIFFCGRWVVGVGLVYVSLCHCVYVCESVGVIERGVWSVKEVEKFVNVF